ncbi:MAG: TlpA disulfide reductase family protein [Candidatus Latescibacterota bacterium]
MRPRYLQFIAAILLLAAGIAPCAAQNLVGRPAPSFELPRLNGSGYIASGDIFAAHRQTILVFWDSSCPHCVQSLLECDSFHLQQTSGDVALVGIHADQGDLAEVYRLIESNGISFPQLWDVGGEAGQYYGIAMSTFTLYTVDRTGIIAACRPDPQGNMADILTGMLVEHRDSTTQSTQSDHASHAEAGPAVQPHRFVFHGKQRIRFLGIDSQGRGAAGPYGEEVQPGNNLLYRFEFEMSRRINRHLRVGGLLRISNEGEGVLESGPTYFGSEWGSAFAEMTSGKLLVRLGFFDISMTPLTLMRWDWDDNPRIGGDAGCGCGAAAGVLLVESLEELDADLVFEGAVAEYRHAGAEIRAFYAIPRRARRTAYLETQFAGAERAQYSLEIYGIESSWRRSDSRSGSLWQAGLRMVGSWENRRSVNYRSLGYAQPDPWYESMVLSADWNIPVIRFIDLNGEWLLWNKAEGHGALLELFGYEDPLVTKGKGGVAGIEFNKDPGWNIRCDYIQLSDEFYSPFAALSYEPNREGFRLSADVPLAGETAVASFFYKRLREIDPPQPEAGKEKISFFGASLDVELAGGVGGSAGWLDNGTWRTGVVDPVNETRKAMIVEARYRFDKGSALQLQYQRIDGTIERQHTEDHTLTNLYSIYLTAQF